MCALAVHRRVCDNVANRGRVCVRLHSSLVQEHSDKFRPAASASPVTANVVKGGTASAAASRAVMSDAAGAATAPTPASPPTLRRRAVKPVHTPAASLRQREAQPAPSQAASQVAPSQLPAAGFGAPASVASSVNTDGATHALEPLSPAALFAANAHVTGLTSFQALSAFLCSAHDPRLATTRQQLQGLRRGGQSGKQAGVNGHVGSSSGDMAWAADSRHHVGDEVFSEVDLPQ